MTNALKHAAHPVAHLKNADYIPADKRRDFAMTQPNINHDKLPDDWQKSFRQALGSFATGVTIITGRDSQGQPRGFTANSFTSVSLDPPIVLFCVATNSASGHAFSRMPRFAVNILSQAQRDTAALFASRKVNKFRDLDWQHGLRATPRLRDPLAWFDCATHRVDEVGDHFVIYGKVEGYGARDEAALGYHKGGWAAVTKD